MWKGCLQKTVHNQTERKEWSWYQLSQPVTSFECPANCLITEGGSETVHTVKVPSAAPYASRLELACPNFRMVTAKDNCLHSILGQWKQSRLSEGLPEALLWSKMQCIPTNEYAGSAPWRCGRSLSLTLELKLVLWLEARLPLRRSCNYSPHHAIIPTDQMSPFPLTTLNLVFSMVLVLPSTPWISLPTSTMSNPLHGVLYMQANHNWLFYQQHSIIQTEDMTLS